LQTPPHEVGAEWAEAWTDKLWVYDLRTNLHFTLTQKPIQPSDFDEFVTCYKASRKP
jgi:type I restriction enzyme M protein